MDWDDYSEQFEHAAANAGQSPEFAQRWLAYAKVLFDRGLPIIYDVEHLCALLGTDYDALSKALNDLGEFYFSYRIPKRTLGYRAIDEPNDALRAIHIWVKTEILDRCAPDEAAMAFVRGRSIKHNALPHVRQQMVLSLDLKNFFPSVSGEMVVAVFQGMGYASDVSATLAALTTLRNGLPQGAATSPPLSNLVMRSFDAELSSCASALGVAYTRYADDITFSGRFQPRHFIWRVRRAARQIGLTVNESSGMPIAASAGNAADTPPLHRYREAYDRVLPLSEALKAEDLITINIDVTSAIATTVGKLPGIMALRDDAKTLPGFDPSVFDQLETLTLATGHAHTLYMGASSAPEAIVELNEKGMQLRNTLYADAVALATRNLISGDRIGEFKANIGYKNLAFDLMALAAVLRGSWDKIVGKTAITTDDLDQAELIGDQLVSAVGSREEAPASLADVAIQRQRNFTLFVNAYDQVRRAVSFLRWNEGDLDKIAPSLYAGRGNSNSRQKPDPQPVPPVPGPVPAPTPVVTPGSPAPVAAPGLPGASPFASVS